MRLLVNANARHDGHARSWAHRQERLNRTPDRPKS